MTYFLKIFLKVSFRMMHKSPVGIYWRQIIQLNEINLCQLLHSAHFSLPVVEYYRKFILGLFPHLPKKCPIAVGKYYDYNISVEANFGTESFQYISSSIFPNGIYRTIFKFYTRDDSIGVMIWSNMNIYETSNVDNVM